MFLAHLNPPNGEPKIFIEVDAKTVALNLARIKDGEELHLEYFEIFDNGTTLVLHPVTLKKGARQKAPAEEVVEIEANGIIAGQAKRVTP